MKGRKSRRRREYELEVRFECAVDQVETEALPGLLGWFRRWRRSAGRVFHEIDVVTGELKRI